MNHNILLDRLRSVGLSDNVVSWFNTYLKGRTQCVQVDGIKSDLLGVGTGVPQGSVLGPLLFIIYINCLDVNIDNARFHFYADDTVIYCSLSLSLCVCVSLSVCVCVSVSVRVCLCECV